MGCVPQEAWAWTSDTILAQVSGILLSVDFVEGTDVKAGQLLAQVDPAPYQAALTQAQGRSNATRRCSPARARSGALCHADRQDSIARQTYADQDALVNRTRGSSCSTRALLATAQVNLNWCRITSRSTDAPACACSTPAIT